jgi:hypothetical protein
MENKNDHPVGTVPAKSNRKVVERGKIDTN